ncbi:16S rRNA (uracil(1498)-N(3))-methyltransferase [Cellvibrio japonicus]|uniref:Ribosomal RNA small subunit methyltransferase E n=1 Tax=Cellvibrio japonicus (strain Ueda107) TaxID=498211 RepID=B3PGT5_CELJU|nr:16S rRNA (uracil(1498)-N(3))-methyltransferase [Cellvibrio japonicus]ACE85118.1 conserved hypothetical protein TIGR00046 [Cellvibrio japonicus Ueda107]QEI12429.1 16S rRNA (uracil(1498)-N(3))-methyltransferase [Cellvibrio japonicus]QEI16002.1 16S rRNA (uracil(1498)-N(3))-methyltransferase [Cellvibrio japonicus]QEI19581.1 16S rRNA (uracil(1498)-N(3))-methyltransferase [Cellvibrio japonicus]
MNLVLLTEQDLESSHGNLWRARIRDVRRYSHITRIHGAKVGDSLKAGILNGPIGQAQILQLTDQEILVELNNLELVSPPALPLTLMLGLPRPKMLKRIFQTIATLGVKQLYLINSYRVEKSYWQTPFLQDDAIHEQLILGLEQGCDTQLPEVHLIKRFKPFVEDHLPDLIGHSRALVAHPYTEAPCPRELNKPVTLAVGPEGGFIPYEVDMLVRNGFTPITLGQRILRVETAIPFLLSRLF